VYERLAGAAGIDVSPDEAWLLLRVDQGEAVTAGELATRYKLEPGAVAAGLEDLARQELVAGTPDVHLTERGRQAVQSMAAARREALQRFLEDWQPEQHAEVLQLLERFARSLRGAPPAGDPVPA
jgi:DNA-binding MarR family transcriptional regulator